MTKRKFIFFESQIVSDDGLEKIDLKESDFIKHFKKYISDHPDIEIEIYPTDGLSKEKIGIMNQIIKDSPNHRITWENSPKNS